MEDYSYGTLRQGSCCTSSKDGMAWGATNAKWSLELEVCGHGREVMGLGLLIYGF